MKLTYLCSSSLHPGKLPFRVLFFGTDHFAVNPLKKLVENSRSYNNRIIENIEVVCPPERRRVINKRFFEDIKHIQTVREYAIQENLPIHHWYGKKGWDDDYSIGRFDIGVVASFGHLITNKVLDLCSRGAVNIHPSLLPQWRGAAPMSYCLLQGQQETGVSVVEVSRNRFDMGRILLQKKIKVPDDIMFDDLSTSLAILGTEMLLECLSNLDESLKNAKVQSTEGGSLAPRIVKEMGYVDWTNDTWVNIWRRWRTLSTRVGLHTDWKGKRVRLVTMTQHKITDETDNDRNASPGQPKYDKEQAILFIKCKDDWAGFSHVQFDCKSVITARDFSNSYLRSLRSPDNTLFENIKAQS